MRQTTPCNDPALFADGPARDGRFVVKNRWVECTNLPAEDPRRQVEFFHRQMNEEMNGLESSARSLSDFPTADWGLRMCLARQCSDEARHAAMFRRILEESGGHVGQYPILNFQYRIIARCPHLVGRLAIQNRCFEAGGIDAITFGIEEARSRGETGLAEIYEAQLADEIVHVRFANEWVRSFTRTDPRSVLQIGAALTAASLAFSQVMGKEGTDGAGYPVASQGRLEAGFSPDEVKVAAELSSVLHSTSPHDSGVK